MKPEYVFIPVLQIRPGLLLTYDICDPRPIRYNAIERYQFYDVTKLKTYSGLITKGSAKRLRKSINVLISLSEWKEATNFMTDEIFQFKINFITLTLPSPQGQISDLQLKQYCLKPWLKYWRRKTNGMSYVWRAERQKNGNLHFHICSDRYIYYKDLRDTWNKQLNKYHFINDFATKHGHRDPNSTDVHSVNKIDDLAGYLVKYMAKLDPKEQRIEGRVWDASTNIKQAKYCDTVIDTDISEELRLLDSQPGNRKFEAERCTGLFINPTNFEKSLPPAISKTYQNYLKDLRSSSQIVD